MVDESLENEERPEQRAPAAELPQLAALLLVVFLVYIPTLFASFEYDDHQYVELNPWLRDWGNLPALLTTMEANSAPGIPAVFWRPLRNVSYLVDYSIAGLTPGWFHFVNVLWHLLAVAGVYVLARRLGIAAFGALVAAAFFGLHPAQVESVAWIKERDGVMAGALVLWSLALAASNNWKAAIASIGVYILALLSKENAVVYAPLVFLVGGVLWLQGRRDSETIRRYAVLTIAGGILAVLFLYIRSRIVGMTAQVEEYPGGSFGVAMWTMMGMLVRYLGLVFVPTSFPISFSHLQAAHGFELLPAIGLVLLVGAFVSAAFLARRRPVETLGLLWFLVALLPVSNLVPTMQWMAVRFLYLPIVGVALVIGSLCVAARRWHHERNPCSPVVTLAVVGVIALLGFRAFVETLVWQSDSTLWVNAYIDNPANEEAILNYSRIQTELGHPEEALAAIQEYPFTGTAEEDDPYAWLTLARAFESAGQLPEALAAAQRGAEIFDAHPQLRIALGRYLAESNRLEEAAAAWERALAIQPTNEAALQNLARAKELLGDADGATQLRAQLERQRTLPRSEW